MLMTLLGAQRVESVLEAAHVDGASLVVQVSCGTCYCCQTKGHGKLCQSGAASRLGNSCLRPSATLSCGVP